MSSIQTYWEKYRDRSKSPAKPEILSNIITNLNNDRLSDLQGQINILEDRLVNLSRQVKLQQNESFDMLETVSRINKIDKILELNQMLSKKTQNSPKAENSENVRIWEKKLEKLVEASEKKILNFIIEKFEEFDKKIQKFEEKIKKSSKSENLISQQFEELRSKLRQKSKSPDTLRKKLEEVSVVQEKLQKIVIDTAEKVKNHKGKPVIDQEDSSKFSRAVEKIGNLLKKYSKAQEILFSDVKSLQAKTRSIENRLESSFALSEPVRNIPSVSSLDDNFKLSFGSEESGINKCKQKLRS